MKPCVKRQTVVLLHKDGSTGEVHRCAHVACESLGRDVTDEVCDACPLRIETDIRPPGYRERMVGSRDFQEPKVLPDGTMIYPKTGWEPPLCPEGYKRKNEDPRSEDAWVFVPVWPECSARKTVNTIQNCGCVKINSLCTSPESDKNGQLVVLSMCQECPVRSCLRSCPTVSVAGTA